jgi:hypothetical protein
MSAGLPTKTAVLDRRVIEVLTQVLIHARIRPMRPATLLIAQAEVLAALRRLEAAALFADEHPTSKTERPDFRS